MDEELKVLTVIGKRFRGGGKDHQIYFEPFQGHLTEESLLQYCKMEMYLCIRNQGGSRLPQILQHVSEGFLHDLALLVSELVHFGPDLFGLVDLAAQGCNLLRGETHRRRLWTLRLCIHKLLFDLQCQNVIDSTAQHAAQI